MLKTREYKEELRILEEIFYESKRTAMCIHDFLNKALPLKSTIYLLEEVGHKMTKEEVVKYTSHWKDDVKKLKDFIEINA